MSPEARAQITALVARLADGDRTAIEPAFDALWPPVRQFCARALGSDVDAEDAAQLAIVRAFDQVADFDRARDALAWVLTIASYEVKTMRRRAGRRREEALGSAADAIADAARGPEAQAIERDLVAAARDVLGTLRREDAVTIEAALGLGGAARDDVTPATFRKRMQRAIERLRVAWRTKHGTP